MVDTASRITPVTLAALDVADLILLVVTPEMAALRNTARFLQLTSQLGYSADKVSWWPTAPTSGETSARP